MKSRQILSIAAAALLGACGSHSNPAGPPPPPPPAAIDPSVLVVNLSQQDIHITFATDTGSVTITAKSHSTTCAVWTQQFDSLFTWVGDPSDSIPHVTVPWLHFADYPYYFQVDTVYYDRLQGDATIISQHIAAVECTP